MSFSRRVVTEQEAISHHLRFLAGHLGPRPVGSDEGTRARQYILDTVKRLGFSPEVQAFPAKVPFAGYARLRTEDGRTVPCWPVAGSPSTPGVLRGVPRLMPRSEGSEHTSEAEPPVTFALAPITLNEEGVAVAAAARRGAAAVLLYRDDVPELYSAVIAGGSSSVPSVTIRRAAALQLAREGRAVELSVRGAPSEALGVNVMVEVGRGSRALLFLAHYDTRPGVPGAYRNASGVAALLELLVRLRPWRGHRILAGFLDAEETGGAGSRHCGDVLQAAGRLRGLRGVVYVSGLGLRPLSIVPARRGARSDLADLAVRCAADAGVAVTARPPQSDVMPPPGGGWPCPAIAVTGPRAVVQYTALDQPDLLHPRHISAVVSMLDRLARSV